MNWQSRFVNPVLEKEFRLRMRTLRSPLALLFYVLILGLLALGFIYVNIYNGSYRSIDPETSQMMFYFLSGAQLVLITFVVPGLTAGSISGEREKQTLNMLLTTQQSSTAIILSKLFSSISFMLYIVFATIPIYSIVFLYGGISPGQVISIFLFYIFLMLVLGAFGVFFSTLIKKTVVSIIATYGVVLVMYGLSGILAVFVTSLVGMRDEAAAGYILAFNPMGALLSIFDMGFSEMFFGDQSSLQIWHLFVPIYSLLAFLALYFSIRCLRPVYKKRKH